MKKMLVLCVVLLMLLPLVYAFSITDFFNKVTGRAAAINPTCADSDGGLSYDAQGSVTICRGSQCKIYKDSCSGNSGNIAERYCKGTNVATKSYKCPGSCKDGACIIPPIIPPNATTCTDSDAGKDYYVKGKGTGLYGNGKEIGIIWGEDSNKCSARGDASLSYGVHYDCCSDSSIYNQLNEAYCDTNGLLQAYGYQCPSGCQDGACIILIPNATLPNATGSMKITVTDKYIVCIISNENCGVLYNANVSVFHDPVSNPVGFDDTSDGTAAFYNLAVGTYTASASATGYYSAKSSFKIVAGDGKYLKIGLEKLRSCTDSDFGKNIFKAGKTEDNRGKSYKDECLDATTIYEGYCSGGYAYQSKYKCPTGYKCSVAMCIQ